LPHYYFDIETTGLDPQRDEIITIQFQKIAIDSGRPEEPLTILKSWQQGLNEKKIIEQIYPIILTSNPFCFVPVGNNLNFEFNFLATKFNKYFGLNINPFYFHSRPHIDLKPVMILLNGGRFKGYHLLLNKSGKGADVPKWYQKKDFKKIIQYIEDEAKAFTDFYTNVHNTMFNHELRRVISQSVIKGIDEFV